MATNSCLTAGPVDERRGGDRACTRVLLVDADLETALVRRGGVARCGDLRRVCSRSAISHAVATGEIVRERRGSYAFPTAQDGRRAAIRLTAVASHVSAAAHWGWAMKHRPDRPWVTVPVNRKVTRTDQNAHRISWRDLDAHDVVDGIVTGPLRTVLDCCVALPFDEALAVADSALRSGMVTRRELVDAADTHPARGRRRVRQVARHASAEAANPFESVLRAICLDMWGLCVLPQVEIEGPGFFARVDLADPTLRIVVEADSFEFHGGRKQLKDDCQRYDELVALAWVVLRFAWEQVMFEPDWVRRILQAVVDQRCVTRSQRRTKASAKRELVA